MGLAPNLSDVIEGIPVLLDPFDVVVLQSSDPNFLALLEKSALIGAVNRIVDVVSGDDFEIVLAFDELPDHLVAVRFDWVVED